jgi:hypothetical protein
MRALNKLKEKCSLFNVGILYHGGINGAITSDLVEELNKMKDTVDYLLVVIPADKSYDILKDQIAFSGLKTVDDVLVVKNSVDVLKILDMANIDYLFCSEEESVYFHSVDLGSTELKLLPNGNKNLVTSNTSNKNSEFFVI